MWASFPVKTVFFLLPTTRTLVAPLCKFLRMKNCRLQRHGNILTTWIQQRLSMPKPFSMTVRDYVTIMTAYYSINLELMVKLSFFCKNAEYVRTHLITLRFNKTRNFPLTHLCKPRLTVIPRLTSRKINNLVLVTTWIKEAHWEGLVHEVKFHR